MRSFLFCVIAMVPLIGSTAHGAGFALSLDVSQGKTTQTVRAGVVAHPLHPRAALNGSASVPFVATWKVARSGADEAKDVLVHFYVVHLERPAEAPPPLDPRKVEIESALTMDFPSGKTAGATLPFRIDRPGVYLVRIEASEASENAERRDFVEIELVVK